MGCTDTEDVEAAMQIRIPPKNNITAESVVTVKIVLTNVVLGHSCVTVLPFIQDQ